MLRFGSAGGEDSELGVREREGAYGAPDGGGDYDVDVFVVRVGGGELGALLVAEGGEEGVAEVVVVLVGVREPVLYH